MRSKKNVLFLKFMIVAVVVSGCGTGFAPWCMVPGRSATGVETVQIGTLFRDSSFSGNLVLRSREDFLSIAETHGMIYPDLANNTQFSTRMLVLVQLPEEPTSSTWVEIVGTDESERFIRVDAVRWTPSPLQTVNSSIGHHGHLVSIPISDKPVNFNVTSALQSCRSSDFPIPGPWL